MKLPMTLLATVLLLRLSPEAFASNPDSEIVQDPTSSDDKNVKNKSPERTQREDETAKNSPTDSQRSHSIVDMRPIQSGATVTRLVMRQVLPGYRNGVPDSSFRRRGNKRPISAVSTDDKSTARDGVDNDNKSFNPRIQSSEELPQVPIDVNRGNTHLNSNSIKGDYLGKYPNPSYDKNNLNNERNPSIALDTSNNNRNIGYIYGVNRGFNSNSNAPNDRYAERIRPFIQPTGQQQSRPSFYSLDQQFDRGVTHNNIGANTGKLQFSTDPPNSFTGVSPVSDSTTSPSHAPDANRRTSLDSKLYASIVNDFVFKLVETLNLDTNFVVSPLSIFVALSMCYLGSDGATKTQLEDVMGLDANLVHGQRFHEGVKDLVSSVLPQSDEYQLLLANGMFLGKNFTVNPEFVENIQNFYAAELKNLDFKNPGSSVPIIDDWVTRSTRNMITSLGDPPSPETVLMLLNAIYFKGIWKTAFEVHQTYNGTFYKLGGVERKVPTMTLFEQTFPFHRSNVHKHSFVKLPYQGDQISMIIALPHAYGKKPMPKMSDHILCELRDAMTDTKLQKLAVPRFKFEHTSSLKEPLQLLGITAAFSHSADFGRMRKDKDIFVDDIVHKAVIEVNEEGTTAAAVTSVLYLTRSSQKRRDAFVANHPFAFYILHEPSGLVLFHGKIFDFKEN